MQLVAEDERDKDMRAERDSLQDRAVALHTGTPLRTDVMTPDCAPHLWDDVPRLTAPAPTSGAAPCHWQGSGTTIMYRMTHPSGNPNRTGLTDKIANAPRLTCGPPDRRSFYGEAATRTDLFSLLRSECHLPARQPLAPNRRHGGRVSDLLANLPECL